MAKMFKLASRDNIETAAKPRKVFENTEISVGFYSEAKSVRNGA